jgi:uncharacterized phiE125 gp8 family phage protein
MAYKVTTGPTIEPITLAEAKAWLKIHPDVSEDDELINSLVASARTWAERNTGRALLTQTIQEVWDCWQRCFELSIGPLITVSPATSGVTLFEYRVGGSYLTWAASNYTVDDVSNPGRVVVNPTAAIPNTSDTYGYPNVVRITYTVGHATAEVVDPNIKTAMLLQLGMMYENREDMPLGKSASPVARSAWALLALSRLNWL